jgi:hypothetical protein
MGWEFDLVPARILMHCSRHLAILLLALLAMPAVAQTTPTPAWPSSAIRKVPEGATVRGQSQLISSNAGLNLNARLGATAVYSAGYTGSAAIAANIEAGHVWNGHESLNRPGQIAQYINGPGTVGEVQGTAAAYDRHATWVGQSIVGRLTDSGSHERQRGIAYGATLWSGAIATRWITSGSFDMTFAAFFQPYVTATRTGINGQKADVVNSSWGTFTTSNQNDAYAQISSGRQEYSWSMDALARDTGKVFVISAGNYGSGGDTVSAPATAYNVISAAALENDSANPSYNTVSGFSSRGPNRAFNPTLNNGQGAYVSAARVRVDLAAPGNHMVLAYYGGATGGNAGGSNDSSTNTYSSGLAGTSFAAPVIAAGATLLVDAGRQLSLSSATDGRVVKAVLLNSADKTSAWNNAQSPVGGVITTTQALDLAAGAGRMNLERALPYYTSVDSTRDVAGTNPGDQGMVQLRGYDFGRVSDGGTNSYTLTGGTHAAGSALAVTLNWFINRGLDSFASPNPTLTENALADLDLQVWALNGGVFETLIATSTSDYNNTEHLYLTNLPAGEYGLRVVHFGDRWDFVNQTSEFYALAWEFQPVPEPASILAVALLLACGAMLRWRRTTTTI